MAAGTPDGQLLAVMGILVGTDRGHAHARDARRGDVVGMLQLGKGLGQGPDENGQGIERQVVRHTGGRAAEMSGQRAAGIGLPAGMEQGQRIT